MNTRKLQILHYNPRLVSDLMKMYGLDFCCSVQKLNSTFKKKSVSGKSVQGLRLPFLPY